MSTLPDNPCARCARALGRSCCEVEEGDALATLTHADIERIQEATGLSSRAFVETEVLSYEEANMYERVRPLFREYFRAGPFRLTLRSKGGACVFWRRGAGCSLSSETRPVACRLYPFEKHADGSWGTSVARYGSLKEARLGGEGPACLAVEEEASFEALLARFRMDMDTLERWAGQLQSEVLAHGRRRA